MAETKPIPVRLSDEITARLDKAADRIGNKRAGLIRLLISSWLDDFEKKGKASLPPDWQDILLANDHRTKESKNSPYPEHQPSGMIIHEGKKVKANSASPSAKQLLSEMSTSGLGAAEKRAALKKKPIHKAHQKAKAVHREEGNQSGQ